jgi:hypothetical protein
MPLSGSCLCGSVRFEIEAPFEHFLYCHCSRCRKATGTAHAANIVVAPERFRWTAGEDQVARYDLPTARSFATAFCKHCGAPMPHPTRSRTRVIVPAGSLDDVTEARPSVHAYWGSRTAWFEDDPDLPKRDEAAF